LIVNSPHENGLDIHGNPLTLDRVLLLSRPLAGWIDSFGEFNRNIVGVIYNMPDRQDRGGALKVEIS
jgi:hypothetical protein